MFPIIILTSLFLCWIILNLSHLIPQHIQNIWGSINVDSKIYGLFMLLISTCILLFKFLTSEINIGNKSYQPII